MKPDLSNAHALARRLVLVAAAVSSLTACRQHDVRAPADYPRDARVDSVFADFERPGSPGATVAVVRNGNIVHAAGYGLADLETGRPLTPETPVRLGSVSKAFISTAVMILEARDSLDFDDPVVRWLPELERFPGITVRHLMTHTSGIPEYYDDDELLQLAEDTDGDSLITNPEAARVYRTWGEPFFKPGERMKYSNSGYEMLNLIVERISGVSMRKFLADNIFAPLDMATAAVRDLPHTEIPDRAIGYRPSEDSTAWIEDDDHWGNWLVGAGGVYASVLDMVKWDQALYGRSVFPAAFFREAFEPTALNDGQKSAYGFGWSTAPVLGHRAISHSGGWVGFRTSILRFPDDELAVIVLSNASAPAGRLARRTASFFLEDVSDSESGNQSGP